MSDQVISVRMPSGLVDELKDLAKQNHFLDVSEEVRSVLRKEWQSSVDPYTGALHAIKVDMQKRKIPTKLKSLKNDLKNLLEEMNKLE